MKKALLYFVVITVVGFIAYGIFVQLNQSKVPGKLDRLPCHKKITAFERGYVSPGDIKQAQKSLLSGNCQIKSDIDKAKFMNSTLFDFINLSDTDKYLLDFIQSKTNNTISYNQGVIVDYTIYENDRKDPKKKSDTCKLYRGYVVLKIKNSNFKTLYQVQIDFMDHQGKDIFRTLQCALNSFLTY